MNSTNCLRVKHVLSHPTYPLKQKKDFPGRKAVQDEGPTAPRVLLEEGQNDGGNEKERLETKSESTSMIEDSFDDQTDKMAPGRYPVGALDAFLKKNRGPFLSGQKRVSIFLKIKEN